jgi:hypothetical protein
MKRLAVIAAAVAVIAAAFYGGARWRADADTPTVATDSVWYHASDVALLATTGRPQLVEFFHPG